MKPFCAAALCTITALIAAPSTRAEEPTPAGIFKTIHAQFTHMQSLDFSCRSAHIFGEIEPDLDWTVDTARERAGNYTDAARIESIHLRHKGKFFRAEIDDSFEQFEYAYNGSRYQRFQREYRMLQLLDDVLARQFNEHLQYSAAIKSLQPYEFAAVVAEKRDLLSFDLMRDAAFWESLAERSVMRGEETVGDHPCVVVDIINTEHAQYGMLRARVYFAKDLAYFPVRYENYIGDDIYHIFEAIDVKKAFRCGKPPENEPAHYFAGRSVLHNFDWMGSGRRTSAVIYEIDAERVRVNCEIPDAFFTIAPSEALHVHDARSTD